MNNNQPVDQKYNPAALWIHTCPYCYPLKVMNISTIIPTLKNGSSTVTYHCARCDYQKQVTIDH